MNGSALRGGIDGHDVQVRYLRTDRLEEHSLPEFLRQLPVDEQNRAASFRFVKDRLAFALGRVLLRKTLSIYAIPPSGGWEFDSSKDRKPHLHRSTGTPPFTFNISHCAGIVAVGLALEREIGIDVESVNVARPEMEIVRSCFAPEEIQHMESLPPAQRPTAFVRYWTLKEAYVKACGKGLTISFANIAFVFEPIRIVFPEEVTADVEDWSFWQARIRPLHVLAVAARGGMHEQLAVCAREVPLESLR
jgi:4'-phosphopantetheinyl transferase